MILLFQITPYPRAYAGAQELSAFVRGGDLGAWVHGR